MLRDRRADHAILERFEMLKALRGEHALDERRSAGPTRGVDSETGERGSAQEAPNADVGDRVIVKDETRRRHLCFEVIQYLWDVLAQGLGEHGLVWLLAPDERLDRHLVEEAPDED